MENIGLVKSIAQSFHKTTGLEFDDLFQEAAWAYLHALKTFNPNKGKITTYVWWHITSHLKNYLKKECKCTDPLDPIDDLEPSCHPLIECIPFWECLSKDAQEITKIILSTPAAFTRNNKSQAHRRVRQIMSQRGWDSGRIQNGIRELKIAYS